MISQIGVRVRWLRRKISRSYLAAHLFGIRGPKGLAAKPGLILIQIDGLSRRQLEHAMNRGNLPFLSRLIKRRHFSLETFYSGIPSTTPAVQGEIFYGQRAVVPAFHFLRRKTGRLMRMYDASAASEVGEELKQKGVGSLINDGHTYSNIYRAEAALSRYCAEDFAPNEMLRHLHPSKWLILAFLYFPKILRMTTLALLELGIAVVDLFKGLYPRKDFLKEIQFVPVRIGVCIVVRELIRFRILIDIERGVRVIHANFIGYDEQAHRRGPDSAFAHWTLLGIDRTVRDIYRAAHRSDYRDYELMVYSDHGQERAESFDQRYDRDLTEALTKVFSNGPLASADVWRRSSPRPEMIGSTLDRYRNILGLKRDSGDEARFSPDLKRQIVLTAMGPIGHLYLPFRPTADAMAAYARELVLTAGVPLVLLPGVECGPRAFNARGEWTLPGDRADVFGADHPFLDEVAEDTVRLCEHPDVGDFVLSGWDPGLEPLSFSSENGSHGGPGYEETRGFLLVPDRIRRWHVTHLPDTGSRVRGEDLRKIGLHFLGRDGAREERVQELPLRDAEVPTTFRIMSYNIHSCRGIDGKIRPERVARVINAFDPDIVAVQEVDAHRPRSGSHDQAELIARHLRMGHVFQAMLEEEKERYGIAVFSKYPFETVNSGLLTTAGPRREARGAIILRIMPEGGMPFYFVNTHFGLRRAERRQQAEVLLGENWLGGISENEPVILCGDFNSSPRSATYRLLENRLNDVWRASGRFKIRPGFPSMMPFLRLDHIFASSHFTVNQVEVPDTLTAKVSSDHLPLCAELTLSFPNAYS